MWHVQKMVSLSRGRFWSSEVLMCSASKYERGVIGLLQDPLIRLVMDSDGVTEQAMIAILEHRLWCKRCRAAAMLAPEREKLAMGKLEELDNLLAGRHFDREVIILCVRWYLRFKLSLRDPSR
jgi:hypothetical protein